jgi:hypothetical protein
MKRTFFCMLCACLGIFYAEAQASFTSGNIVLLKVGDGSTTLSSSAFPVSLMECNPNISPSSVQTVSVPTSASGSNNRLTQSGTATSEGNLSLSGDGRYLLFGGYDAATGTANVSSAGTWNRVVARVDVSGAVNTSTSLTGAYTNNSFRSVCSSNGSDLWLAGNSSSTTGGIRYYTYGASGSAGIPITTNTNIRNVEIFKGQLYASSGSSGITQVNTVGTGLATTGTVTLSGSTILPGTTSGTPSNPGAFVLLDMDENITGADLCYIADGSNGIFKFAFDGVNWNAKGCQSGAKAWGLTAAKNPANGNIRLYTISNSTANNAAVYYEDQAAFNANLDLTTPTTIASAGSNFAFRGIAFAPSLSQAPADLLITSNQDINAGNYGDINISSGTAELKGNINITGTLTVSAGATLDCGSFCIHSPYGVFGSFNLEAGGKLKMKTGISSVAENGNILTFTRFYNVAADYYCYGSAPDMITEGFPDEMHDLTLDNNNGISLEHDLIVNGNLFLVSGVINCQENTFEFSSTASVSGASSTSYIKGRVKKTGNSSFYFPVGENGLYKPLVISSLSSITDAYAVEYHRSNPGLDYDTSYMSRASSLQKISGCEYWYIEHLSGADADITLNYDDSSYVNSISDLRMTTWNGTSWIDDGSYGVGCTPNASGYCTNGSITVPALSNFGALTFATASYTSPLPVTLIYFNGKIDERHALLSWATASEHNSEGFEIERSSDGIHYEKIGYIKAALNSFETRSYSFTDIEFENQSGSVVYYRLKKMDIDGAFSYSKIIGLKPYAVSSGITINNPVSDRLNIRYTTVSKSNITVEISSGEGILVKKESFQIMPGSNRIEIDISGCAQGLFYIMIRSEDGNVFRSRVMVQP